MNSFDEFQLFIKPLEKSKKDLMWMKSMRNSKQDQADIERLKNDKD